MLLNHAAIFLWLTPVLAVGAGGFGLRPIPAIVAGAALAGVVAVGGGQRLHRRLAVSPLSWPEKIVVVLAASVAILRIGALSIFMADVGRTEYSVDLTTSSGAPTAASPPTRSPRAFCTRTTTSTNGSCIARGTWHVRSAP